MKSTCPSDNHHIEFGCPRPKSACPKRFVQTSFRNKINSTCGFWCILIYSNVNCELITRVQMLLKMKKNRTFSTLLQVTHLIPCRYDDLIDSKTFRCFFLFNDILSLVSNFSPKPKANIMHIQRVGHKIACLNRKSFFYLNHHPQASLTV